MKVGVINFSSYSNIPNLVEIDINRLNFSLLDNEHFLALSDKGDTIVSQLTNDNKLILKEI